MTESCNSSIAKEISSDICLHYITLKLVWKMEDQYSKLNFILYIDMSDTLNIACQNTWSD